jgi:biopolymer transport protein ExbD
MGVSRTVARIGMQAEPNVTPFLDVLLVLLIIFMYLSLSQQKVITAQLPDPTPLPGPNTPSIVLEVRPSTRSTPASSWALSSRAS